jgi:hypothetical protein
MRLLTGDRGILYDDARRIIRPWPASAGSRAVCTFPDAGVN